MNMSTADLADMSAHIKEEPIDYEILTPQIVINADVSVKDEPIEEEYNESPSPSIHQGPEEDVDIVTDPPLSHVTNDDPRKCVTCDKIFSSMSNRIKHQIDIHYGEQNDLSNSLNRKTKIIILICEICNRMFTSMEQLKEHKLSHEKQDMSVHLSPNGEANNTGLICEICNQMFTSKEELQAHKLSHQTMPMQESVYASRGEVAYKCKKKFVCKLCDKQYVRYSGLWRHNRQIHPENKSRLFDKFRKRCTYCYRIFHTAGSYFMHRRMHVRRNDIEIPQPEPHEIKPPLFDEEGEDDLPIEFRCDMCLQSFATRMAVEEHRETHAAAIQPLHFVYCMHCKIFFANRVQFTNHMMNEHVKQNKPLQKMVENNNYVCNVCGKTYSSMSAKRVHQGWHKRGMKGEKTNKTETAAAVEVNKKLPGTTTETAAAVEVKKELPGTMTENAAAIEVNTELPGTTTENVAAVEVKKELPGTMTENAAAVEVNKELPGTMTENAAAVEVNTELPGTTTENAATVEVKKELSGTMTENGEAVEVNKELPGTPTENAAAVEVKQEPQECSTGNTECSPNLDLGVGPIQTIPHDGGEATQSTHCAYPMWD